MADEPIIPNLRLLPWALKDRELWHIVAFFVLWNAVGGVLLWLFWLEMFQLIALVFVYGVGTIVLARMVAFMGTSA